MFLNAAFNYNKFTTTSRTTLIDNPERLELANPANGRNVINDATTFRLWLAARQQRLHLRRHRRDHLREAAAS